MKIKEDPMPRAYESIVHMIPDIIYKLDADGCFTYINNSIRNLGYEPGELIDKHFSVLIHPDDVDGVCRTVVVGSMDKGSIIPDIPPKLFDERRTGKRITRDLQVRLIPKDNSIIEDSDTDLVASCRVISVGTYHARPDGADREFTGTLGVIKDMGNVKRSQESLLRSIDYYQSLVELSNDIFIVIATDGTILFSSTSLQRILGFNPADMAGENIFDYLHKEDMSDLFHSYSAAWEGEPIFSSRSRILNVHNEWHTFDIKGKSVFDVHGKIMYITAIINDITPRIESEERLKKAHAELEDSISKRTADLAEANASLKAEIEYRIKQDSILQGSEKKYRNLVNSIDDVVLNIDPEGSILFTNPAIKRITGYDQREIIGRNLLEFIHRDDIDCFLSTFHQSRDGSPGGTVSLIEALCSDNEIRMIKKDEDPVWVELRCRPVTDESGTVMGFRGIAHDITRRKMMEEEMIRKSKIESLAILAAGIAHDFNNLLTAIIGNLSLAKIKMLPDDPNYTILSEAENASDLAKNLTHQLMAFSRGGFPEKKITSIRNLLEDTAYFVLRGSEVKCEMIISDSLWEADIDRGQISQVIHNIILNARQAMPDGGTITLIAENHVIDGNAGLPIKNGKYIKISIEDQGHGIPDDIISRIFDPYFTTKESGSGLGLAISYSIIKKHDGQILVKSKDGAGSVFTVYLPAVVRETVAQMDDLKRSVKVSGGKILLMDDEKIILELGVRLLGHLGYEVISASNGYEAIELYKKAKEEGSPFDLVILDLIIPDGFGADRAIDVLKEIEPGVRTIVTSGYGDDPVMLRYADHGFTGVLAKPFSLEELEQELTRVMSC
jgi:two-component system, cell cycle sensor histidine kinase and response regulator CckA